MGTSRFGYIFCAVIRQKIFKKKTVESMGCIKNRPHESFLERSILFQHKKNCDDLKLRKTKEKVMRYDGFENWKRSICLWFKKNPKNYMDLLRWEFESDVRIWGGIIGVIWDGGKFRLMEKVLLNVGLVWGWRQCTQDWTAQNPCCHFKVIYPAWTLAKQHKDFYQVT